MTIPVQKISGIQNIATIDLLRNIMSGEVEKYNHAGILGQNEGREVSADLLIDIDRLTESKLPEFGLRIEGGKLICDKQKGAQWMDDFSGRVPDFGRMETEQVIGDTKLRSAMERIKNPNHEYYLGAKSIKLRYQEDQTRPNMMAEYSAVPYIEYQIYFSDSKNNKHYHIEWDGMRHLIE